VQGVAGGEGGGRAGAEAAGRREVLGGQRARVREEERVEEVAGTQAHRVKVGLDEAQLAEDAGAGAGGWI